MYNENLCEAIGIKSAGDPADLNTAGLVGAKLDMSKGDRVAVICHMGDSVGATVEFTFKQSLDAAGTGIKDLSIAGKYYHKVGAATVFTEVDVTTAAANRDLSTLFAAEPGIVVFMVHAEDLDVNNDFSHFSVNVTDPAAAKIFDVQYHVLGSFNKPAYEIAL